MQGLAQRIAGQEVSPQTLRLAPAPEGAHQRLTVLGAAGEFRLPLEVALVVVEHRNQRFFTVCGSSIRELDF